MKGIEIRNGCLYYYGNTAGYIDNDGLAVDNMFRSGELESWINKHGFDYRWMDGVYDRLANSGPVQPGELPVPLKSCRIWQLKPDVDVMMKFISYAEMTERFGEPDRENYDLVYDGQIETNDLEDIWTKFNARLPPGYTGHSISMSDVIELYDHNSSEFHFVDRFGFKQICFDGWEVEQMQGMDLSM
jgi:hypothetical protein